jgi:hypothetical protein
MYLNALYCILNCLMIITTNKQDLIFFKFDVSMYNIPDAILFNT